MNSNDNIPLGAVSTEHEGSSKTDPGINNVSQPQQVGGLKDLEASDTPPASQIPTATPVYPSGIKFWLAVTTLCLAIFLTTLVSPVMT